MSTDPLNEARAEATQPAANEAAERPDAWLEALLRTAAHYRLQHSAEQARVTWTWLRDRPLDERLERLARDLGLQWRWATAKSLISTPAEFARELPLILELRDGSVLMAQTVDLRGCLEVFDLGPAGLRRELGPQQWQDQIQRVLVLRPQVSVPDARVDDYIKPFEPNWLVGLLTKDAWRYADVAAASVVANVLALATVLFSMQVYDRVIPAQSMPTLWVLFGGVMIAMAFELLMKLVRTRIGDLVGKRADMRISDRVFGHALRLRHDAKPASTGSFISQLRELEQVREMITSTTLSVLADLPFMLLFAVVMFMLAGNLAWVPILGIPLMLLPGLLAQRKLAQLSQEGMRESAIRNAILIEAVQGSEDIKLARAEERFLSQWNHLTEVSAQIGLRQRGLTNFLQAWSQEVSSLVYAVVLLVGAVMVMENMITTGVLVAASILSSRMLTPMGPLANVLTRWQHAKVAIKGLNELLQRPVDHPKGQVMARLSSVSGRFELRQARFSYDPRQATPTVDIPGINIAAGGKLAVLGRNGAGKSTLLYMLSGLLQPQSGDVLLDQMKLSGLDPADVRREVVLLSQNASLFFGSIRDNLTLGMPDADDASIARALELSGALGFVNALPAGLNHIIKEGGHGLSGGQRQALLLARTVLRNPQVLILDEPTAWMDEVTERQVIQNLSRWLGSRTLIVATHRLPVLSLVEHVLVLEGGKPVLLDTRDKVLQSMRGGRLNPAAVVPATSAKSEGAVEEVPQAGAAGGGHE